MQIPKKDVDNSNESKLPDLNARKRYSLKEKFNLGKVIDSFKENYERECQANSKFRPKKNRRTTKPTTGYLSKAIRHQYPDLKNVPSEDKTFKRALSLGKRSYDYYKKCIERPDDIESPSNKRFKIDGGGRKTKAVDVRARLFQWFIGKKLKAKINNIMYFQVIYLSNQDFNCYFFSLDIRSALKGRLPISIFRAKCKEFYLEWLSAQPEPIPEENQLKFTDPWICGWMNEYGVCLFMYFLQQS